jgi:type VI secretion system secreted protein VgrG
MSINPTYRLLSITSPLGAGALVPVRLSVEEQLGLPYAIHVEVLGTSPGLTGKDLLTRDIVVTVTQQFGSQDLKRHFHGHVAGFERLGPGPAGRTAYRLTAVPGIWRLGLATRCRVFEGKTAKAVVDSVISDHGLPAATWGILPSLEPIPYCTQFNETDLHFVSRILEEHGLTYYFTHTDSTHTLHISATSPGFPAFEGGSVVAVHNTPNFGELGEWRRAQHARSAAMMFDDMDTERSQPSVVLTKNADTRVYADEPAMWSSGKVNRWPGGMSTRTGLDSAAVAMGQAEAAADEFTATAIDPRYVPGARATVAVRAEDRSETSQQYVVTAVRHVAADTTGLTAGAGGIESYSGSLQMVAASRTWMPPQRHTRPVMAGLYSAKVTGPSGEKIHVDAYGRIKIKFRWDRSSADDDTTSIWVRVAQAAAGSWGGTWFLPRVGDEVLVAFLDGDPDRPLVTGSVYGKDAKPPFLPGANRAQSGIRTRSYKSDSAEDANILRFEDKKGDEEVLLHAQKDLTVEVEHDEVRKVDHDQKETIKNSRTVTINDSDDTLTVDKGNVTHTISMGDLKVTCKAGSITMEAMQKITLKVGNSTVVIDQMGVTTKGMTISDEAQLQHKTKATMIQEDGDAMIKMQGGIVMVN